MTETEKKPGYITETETNPGYITETETNPGYITVPNLLSSLKGRVPLRRAVL